MARRRRSSTEEGGHGFVIRGQIDAGIRYPIWRKVLADGGAERGADGIGVL
jgi:hypothetical protein